MLTKAEIFNHLRSYNGISECFRIYSAEDILISVAKCFNVSENEMGSRPMGGYSKGKTSGSYWFVLNDIKKNIDYYDWLYKRLADNESRRVFYFLMAFRLFPDIKFISAAYDGNHPQYFDTDIVICDENEVFVDCGGYIGDTVQSYINTYSRYKKMYVYEPDPDNFKKASSNLNQYDNIAIKNAGVGDRNELVGFSSGDSAGSFLSSDESSEKIQLISIDEDIHEPVTYIKMDIEGFEIPTITGAKNHIRKEHPKLAICLYHIVSDLWEIPKLIDSLVPEYRFYIRHYEKFQNWETVLYAIPPAEKCVHNKFHSAATICPYDRAWYDVELTKDCGLIPYLFHKKYDMEVKIIGTTGKPEDYPSSELVDGVSLISLPKNDLDTKLRYITDHGKEIDLLLLYGGHYSNALIAAQYKHSNPDGLIYCGLDANSHWMDRLDYTEETYQHFLDSCDVLATSCTSMARFLSKKWHRNIHLVTNGYYDFTKEGFHRKNFEEKQNIILTVGRLGTAQKRTNVLLAAFALIADEIPDWTLRLVGSVEESFNEFLTDYFYSHPQLNSRVIFTGKITNKHLLMEEYENAKIFALTSFWEGAPNVISESLTCGCVSAVTEFDAYEDCTDSGNCGLSAKIDDIKEFAAVLKGLCISSDLKAMSEHAREYAAEFFDMEKNVAKIHDLLFEQVEILR